MAQSNTEEFEPLSQREQWLGEQIVAIAIQIHVRLGPGLLERIYEQCFCYELGRRGIPFQTQKAVSLYYSDQLLIEDGLRLDLLVDDRVIVELKAQDLPHPVWHAQLLSYMKLCRIRLGYLINFNVPLMKDGIKRKIL